MRSIQYQLANRQGAKSVWVTLRFYLINLENCNDQGVCDLVKCQHGGQCLVQKDENPTCLCPLGFSGPLCETPLDLQVMALVF